MFEEIKLLYDCHKRQAFVSFNLFVIVLFALYVQVAILAIQYTYTQHNITVLEHKWQASLKLHYCYLRSKMTYVRPNI